MSAAIRPSASPAPQMTTQPSSSSVVTGGKVTIGIDVKDWTAAGVAKLANSNMWTHVACSLEDPTAGNASANFCPPNYIQAIQEGKRNTWSFQLPEHWAEGKTAWVYVWICDANGNNVANSMQESPTCLKRELQVLAPPAPAPS